MELNIYSVYDVKANAYLPPFYLPTEGMAIRTFTDCVNSKDHQFGAHPEDYTLMYFGIFNDKQGSFEPLHPPKTIRTGLQVKNVTQFTEINDTIGDNNNHASNGTQEPQEAGNLE